MIGWAQSCAAHNSNRHESMQLICHGRFPHNCRYIQGVCVLHGWHKRLQCWVCYLWWQKPEAFGWTDLKPGGDVKVFLHVSSQHLGYGHSSHHPNLLCTHSLLLHSRITHAVFASPNPNLMQCLQAQTQTSCSVGKPKLGPHAVFANPNPNLMQCLQTQTQTQTHVLIVSYNAVLSQLVSC